MSILLGSADAILLPVLLALAVAISLLAASACGVFAPQSIVGPPRLDEDERASDIAIITLIGLLSWIMAQSIYVAIRQLWFQRVYHIQKPPTKLSDAEIVVFNSYVSLIVFLTMYTINALWRRHGLQRLGLTFRQIPPAIWKGTMAIIILLPMIVITSIATDAAWARLHIIHPPEHELLTILRDTPHRWLKLAVIASAAIVAPLAEETFFRGHVQTMIRYLTGSRWLAIVSTSFFFAAVHPWWTTPPIFLLALGLGYLYERTGNLWACIVMHAMFNCASIALFYYLQMMPTT